MIMMESVLRTVVPKMIFNRTMMNRFFSITRKIVLGMTGMLGFLPFCHAAINEDLLQLLSRNSLVQYDDSYYVRVFSEEKYDGTTYTATKVGQILMKRFCPDQTQGQAKRRMKTKIRGLAVVDYQPMYRGSYTTFKFPLQSVECVQLAKVDELKKNSQSNGSKVTQLKKLKTKKTEYEDEKALLKKKLAKNHISEKETMANTNRTSTVEKRKDIENGTGQDRDKAKQNLNEILGKQVILGNKNKLVDEYYGLIFTEYSDEY